MSVISGLITQIKNFNVMIRLIIPLDNEVNSESLLLEFRFIAEKYFLLLRKVMRTA